MKKFYVGLCCWCLTAGLLHGRQVQSITVDLQRSNRAFAIKAAEETTPTLRAYLREDGRPYTSISDLNGIFFFASNATAEAGMVVTNTAKARDYLEWTLTTSQTAEPGTYFAQIIVTNTTGSVQEWIRGTFTIEESPGTTALAHWTWNSRAISFATPVTGPPGSSAAVTNLGTSTALVLLFTIPQGATGQAGPITNQLMDAAGVVYTLTNNPSAGAYFYTFHPGSSNVALVPYVLVTNDVVDLDELTGPTLNLRGWAGIKTNGGVDAEQLSSNVNASLDLADSALQPAGNLTGSVAGVAGATLTNQVSAGVQAHAWGNHASAGYLQVETDSAAVALSNALHNATLPYVGAKTGQFSRIIVPGSAPQEIYVDVVNGIKQLVLYNYPVWGRFAYAPLTTNLTANLADGAGIIWHSNGDGTGYWIATGDVYGTQGGRPQPCTVGFGDSAPPAEGLYWFDDGISGARTLTNFRWSVAIGTNEFQIVTNSALAPQSNYGVLLDSLTITPTPFTTAGVWSLPAHVRLGARYTNSLASCTNLVLFGAGIFE